MNRWQHAWRLIPLIMAMTLLLSGCGKEDISTLNPAGPVAKEQFDLIVYSIAIMMLVVTVVTVIYVYVLIRYRKRPGQEGIPKQVEGSTKLEIIWTVIPIILLIFLMVPTVAQIFSMEKDYSEAKDTLNIKVTAFQYWWQFEYPDLGIVTSQEFYIPVGKRVQFEVKSTDVTHSFWIPALGGKKDANPENPNKLWLIAEKTGTFKGKCAELCGPSHALMDFKVHVVPQEEFDAWVAKMKAPVKEPADGLAATGKDVFKNSCAACHAIENRPSFPGGGPNLRDLPNRQTLAGILENKPEELKRWLKDPQDVKPGNKMPNLHLTDEQINALADYLYGLK